MFVFYYRNADTNDITERADGKVKLNKISKKMEKILLQQLKSLNKIQPSTKWKETAREDILAQIVSEDSPRRLGKGAEFFYFLKFSGGIFHDFIMRPAGTFILVLFLVLGGGVLKVKADSSLPGDWLYSLKRGGEKAQIALVFDENKKSELRLEMIEKRVKELNKIALKENDNQERIKKALENFHKDFVPIKENLSLAQKDSGNALKIAQKIEDKTSEMHFILNKTQNKVKNSTNKQDIKKVIDEVSKANLNALEIIVKKNDLQKKEEISQKIDEKIAEVSKEVVETGDKEALIKLKEAKENLANMEFVAALQKVKESKEILNQEKERFNKESLDDNSTSTIKSLPVATSTKEIEVLETFLKGKVKGESTSTFENVLNGSDFEAGEESLSDNSATSSQE